MRFETADGSTPVRRVLRTLLASLLAIYLCIPASVSFADEGQADVEMATESVEQSDSGEGTSADESAEGGEASDKELDAGQDGGQVADRPAADDAVGTDGAGESEDASPQGFQSDRNSEESASREKELLNQDDHEAGVSESPVDLAPLWEAGSAVVSSPGAYILGSDVEASTPLKVELAAGEVATIDLAGHDTVVRADSDSGDACAIDLSGNAGAVTFLDSSADEADCLTYSSVILSVENPEGICAVVSDVRSQDTRGAAPSALFKHVSLVADIAWNSQIERADGLRGAAVARTAADDSWQTSDVEVPVSFESCRFGMTLAADENGEAQRDGVEAFFGKTSLIDAQRRGIRLDGACSAFVVADGEDASGVIDLPLLSSYDSSYEIGPDFSLANASQQIGFLSHLVFGFPTKALAEGAGEAIVATAFAGKVIPTSVRGQLLPETGYDAQFNESKGKAGGFDTISLMQSVSTDAFEANGEVASAAAEESAVEPARVSSENRYLSTPSTRGAADAADQGGEVDLNEAWSAQENALKSPFTITGGGTYYLSADFEAESNLVIDAEGADVILKFNGHALTLDGAGTALHKTMLRIANAHSVVLDGSATSGTSSLISAGELDVWGISCEGAGCAVSANDLAVTIKTKSNTQRNLSTHAIRTESGMLSLSRCTVHMDMGNQALKNVDKLNDKSPETPSAVYATAEVDSVVLEDCTVIGEGPQGFSLSDVSDTTTIGNAYALFSLAESTIVRGGSYKAISARGNATCLYGTGLKVQSSSASPAVKLEADAGQVAAGILSTRAGTVLVDAPLDFTVGGDFSGTAQAEAALRSSVDDGFVFGGCMPIQSGMRYPALVLKDADIQSANSQGAVVGSFHTDLTQADRDVIFAALANALSQGACTLASDSGRVVFLLDPFNAVACIDDTTYYSTFKEALAAFGNGRTIKLLKDAGALSISQADNATLDLNGHTIASLEYADSTGKEGLLVKNGAIVGTTKMSAAQVSVYHHATAPLTLSNVAITTDVADANAYGVYASANTGVLTLKNETSVQVKIARFGTTSGVSAYGVNMPLKNGPSLVLEGAKISVLTASAGVSVFGLYSSTSAIVSRCSISVSGTSATACAAYAGGSLVVSGSDIDVYTLDSASIAAGIWARTTSPKATSVSVDSCAVLVRSASADIEGSTYACLLGAINETGTAAPSGAWTLSGSNTFQCVGKAHIGLNVGDVVLADDFGLSSSSESPLVISQASRTNDVGMTLAKDTTAQQAETLATLFKAEEGSNYEGWVLAPDLSDAQKPRLVWLPEGSTIGGGVVQVIHGTTTTAYSSFAAALAKADDGDTLKLLADFAETGSAMISENGLIIDLNSHTLTLRAGAAAKAASSSTGALVFSGSGSFVIRNGTLDIRVGSATETAQGTSTYQGIAVSGGGTLTVASDAAVNVAYTGSTASAAVQRSVELRGISVTNGALSLLGTLDVTAARADGAIGALGAYGVFAEPSSEMRATVDIAQSASVHVISPTGAIVAKNTYYAEAASGVQAQSGPVGLREITIDPEADPDFYQEVLRQFRLSASYDDPNDSTARNTFNTSIYYAEAMALNPEDESAWYYGLKIWAYTDEVKPADVGKASVMVPTHFFVSSAYDTLPEAVGVATSASSSGLANVTVNGSVAVQCSHGNACALSAAAAAAASVSWSCVGAALSAQADSSMHLFAGEQFDLRDYIAFTSSQNKRVAYSSATNSKVVRYGLAKARDVGVDENVEFTLDGAEHFSVLGTDAANVEASSFTVGPSFAMVGESKTCTIANELGENKVGDVFAMPSSSARLDAGLFADAYKSCGVAIDGEGRAVWAERAGSPILFKVGDAVVARYENPLFINLSEVSALAARVDDQRQSYELLGWSTCADENATSGYEAANALIHPSDGAVYYAVYGTGLTEIPIVFANVFDADGNRVQVPTVLATYGQTVGDAFAAAGQTLPEPQDYIDEERGVMYRFVGWYVSSSATPSSSLMYGPDEMAELEATLALSGVNSGSLTLHAAYAACAPGQHVVTFVVDGYRSVCVVDDGERPMYTSANSSNSEYVDPTKQETETGKTYSFARWFVDEDGDGELGEGEPAYASVLPPATSDVTYTADYGWEWSDITYTFYVKYVDKETGAFMANGVRLVKATYEDNTQELADGVAKIGSSFGYGGKVYTLDGWTTRKTDVDPLYDADNPLPSVSDENRALSGLYSSTYYGVYSSSDHYVTVTFFEGEEELGQAKVTASSTAVNAAFAATGATTPADHSQDEVFLGWATSQGAAEAIEGSSTSIESLAPGAQEALSLFAVFGQRPTYTVRLRAADGSSVLYSVAVKRGDTVAATLVAAGVAVSIPSQEGCYFVGWRTAAGKDFTLDTPVTGSADYYASYADVVVESFDSNDIDATATVSYTASTKASSLDDITGVTFTLVSRDTADSPLRTATAKNSYTILKCYDMRLVATAESGTTSQITGDFGAAQLKVYVGTKYRNGQVRAFWLGEKNGAETAMNSSVKEVDSDGYITLSIGNFTIGDEDEGGNLVIAYVEGGKSSGTLPSDEADTDSSSSLKPGGSSGSTINSSGLSGTLGGSTLGGNTLGSSSLGTTLGSSSLSGSLSTNSLSGTLGSSLSSSTTSSGLSTGSGLSSSLNSSSSSSLASSSAAALEGGAGEKAKGEASGDEEGADAEDEGWGSEAWVLLLIGAGLLAALLRKLWIMFVAKPRRDEEEAEMPAMEEQYAEGIHF